MRSPRPKSKKNGNSKRLKQAHAALQAEGIQLNVEYLRDHVQFWDQFSDAGDRSPAASWSVHLKAGDPQTLREVIAYARTELKKSTEQITVDDVRNFRALRNLERKLANRANHEKLKDRTPSGIDLVYLSAFRKGLAALAKASQLLETRMPTPRSIIDRQDLYDAYEEIIEKCTKKRDSLPIAT